MRTKIITLLLTILVVIVIFPPAVRSASAHITKGFGNYLVEVGWDSEPPLTGQMNSAQVTVVKGSHIDNGQPMINALANMQISVKYGTLTKPLDFLPSKAVDGQYLAPLIPTRVGTYSLIMKGTIEGQAVDTEIPLDDVASSDTLSFPQVGTSGNANGDVPSVGPQLNRIIAQLVNDIDATRQSVNSTLELVAEDQKSVQDAKNVADRSYIIGMVGIGIGGGGIVIAAFSLTRRSRT